MAAGDGDARIGDAFVHGGLDYLHGGRSGRLFGFDIIANFSHIFYKPYAVTFDFPDMQLYVTGRQPA
jgi:hypothetical protein